MFRQAALRARQEGQDIPHSPTTADLQPYHLLQHQETATTALPAAVQDTGPRLQKDHQATTGARQEAHLQAMAEAAARPQADQATVRAAAQEAEEALAEDISKYKELVTDFVSHISSNNISSFENSFLNTYGI